MKVFTLVSLLCSLLVFSNSAVIAQENAETVSASAPTIDGNIDFRSNELPARLFSKPSFKESADKILADCLSKEFDIAMAEAQAFAQQAKPKKDEIALITATAESLESSNLAKSVALHMMAYQGLKIGGKATADDAVSRIFKITSVITSVKTTDAERRFATGLVEQGLQTRRIAGGIKQSDAPYVLLHARLEFSLKRWDSAIKEYEYWLGMYTSKGQEPPANELPDALGELGIAYNSLKNLTKAEEYFTRACAAANAFNETTVTPVNQYDVEDFLIFNLLTQHKLDHAKELAQDHLKFKEKTLGLRSPQLAVELNRYADLFEQAGETSFSFSLRARAGRVVSP
jgi:tetratricopeptide (TPR) repeat protein